MANAKAKAQTPFVAKPEDGRAYDMGRMKAVFFVDRDEADGKFSISEWSLEAKTRGPGAHAHPEDHIFRVLSGTLSVFLDGQRQDLEAGSYVVIPGGTEHDFENHGGDRCSFISINTPAGFEEMLPGIVSWFADKPLATIEENEKTR